MGYNSHNKSYLRGAIKMQHVKHQINHKVSIIIDCKIVSISMVQC